MEERNKEKHAITKDEIEFLKVLQHEMNTQDTVCQADPRFWVVVQHTKEYVGEDYGTDCDLIGDCEVVIDDCTIEKIVEYCKENYQDELDEYGIYFIKPSENSCYYWYIRKKENPEDEPNEEMDDELTIFDINDILEYLTEENILSSDYHLAWYNVNETTIVPNTMFLTLEEAKNHIASNHYHYTNPRPYAMTAWRSPQVRKLYEILQKVDWDKIETE